MTKVVSSPSTACAAEITFTPARAQVANSPAHGDKRAEVAAEAFVRFFIQTSEGAEAVPVELGLLSLQKIRLPFDLLHAKRGHDTVEITLFSAGPPEENTQESSRDAAVGR